MRAGRGQVAGSLRGPTGDRPHPGILGRVLAQRPRVQKKGPPNLTIGGPSI